MLDRDLVVIAWLQAAVGGWMCGLGRGGVIGHGWVISALAVSLVLLCRWPVGQPARRSI